jgi:alginate production protein
LTRGANDDDLRLSSEFKLEGLWLPSETSAVFASAQIFGELDIAREGGNARREGGIALENLWWLKTDLFGTPLALQIGRQRLRERREFWWDDNIDGVRLHYFGKSVTGYVGIGTPVAHLSSLGRMDPEEKGLMRAFGNVDWEWKKRQHVELFGLHQKDHSRRYSIGQLIERGRADNEDANLTWLGARARGCFKPGLVKRLCYWGDIARVRGIQLSYDLDGLNAKQQIVDDIDRNRVRGWAYDAGINLELPLKFRPVVTIARARGSGDRRGTPGVNGAFRQTGLHANDSKYRGLSRFRSYGEVLRPDLSNIQVTTLSLGVPLGKSRWIEVLWHKHRQPVADNRITTSPIGENPDGTDRRLGDEFDINLSHRGKNGWEFEFTAGAFRAGQAFGPEAGRWAGLAELKVDYNF